MLPTSWSGHSSTRYTQNNARNMDSSHHDMFSKFVQSCTRESRHLLVVRQSFSPLSIVPHTEILKACEKYTVCVAKLWVTFLVPPMALEKSISTVDFTLERTSWEIHLGNGRAHYLLLRSNISSETCSGLRPRAFYGDDSSFRKTITVPLHTADRTMLLPLESLTFRHTASIKTSKMLEILMTMLTNILMM